VPLPDRIHILGASGSGTTSLAAAIAATHGHVHLDTDDFFWLPTDPPYRERCPADARLALLRDAFARSPRWVLSGSLCGWGDPLISEFELVVFVLTPTDVRLARLRAREAERYGAAAIAPGGRQHEASVAFLDWAAGYDASGADMRSRMLHEAWLASLAGRIIRLDGVRPIAAQLDQLERYTA